MKDAIWMCSVFFALILFVPILMIIMVLVMTEIPPHYAVYYWTPIAIPGSLALTYWYRRKAQGAV